MAFIKWDFLIFCIKNDDDDKSMIKKKHTQKRRFIPYYYNFKNNEVFHIRTTL